MKATRTWVVVADGRSGRVYQNDGPGRGLQAVAGGSFEAPRLRDQDVYADRPGRTHDSGGQGRHAMERPSSTDDQLRGQLVAALTKWLDQENEAGQFDRLVLVAAPKSLGTLRNKLSANLRHKLAGESHKDLTKAAPAEIVEALSDTILL